MADTSGVKASPNESGSQASQNPTSPDPNDSGTLREADSQTSPEAQQDENEPDEDDFDSMWASATAATKRTSPTAPLPSVEAQDDNAAVLGANGDFNDGPDPDAEDAMATEAYEDAQRVYRAKTRHGKNTIVDDIEWEKVQNEESKRKARFRQQELGDGGPRETIFVSSDSEHEGITLPLSQPIAPVRRSRISQRAAPILELNEDVEPVPLATIREASKKRPAVSPTSKSAKKPRKSAAKPAAAKTPKQKKPKKPTVKQQVLDRREKNLMSGALLGNTSVFGSARNNNARAEQPTFTATDKSTALKQLLANIPTGSSGVASRADARQLDEASKKFGGRGACMPDGKGEWKVKGLHSTLTHYQMLGVATMRERETEVDGAPTEQPAGGIHADAMGLGKTVMAVANIINDRYIDRNKREEFDKPTLIVAPSAIIFQWMDELKKHADPSVLGTVMRWSSAAVSTNDDIEMLAKVGVVMTTYQQVQKSYPKRNYPPDKVTPQQKQEWWEDHYQTTKGILHHIHWRRVILDEANAIKNHLSETSMACSELDADFRWALTGTPAMNSLQEFYSYFRFLKAPNTHTFDLFKRNFMSDDDGLTGNERLIAYLRPFMIRRTHDDEIFGAKLLNLPTPSRDTYWCNFSDMHRALYNVVRERFIEKINTMANRDALRKQYRSILTLILRLRQLTGHPLMIQDTVRDLLEPSDFVKIEDILNSVGVGGVSAVEEDHELTIRHIRRMLQDPKSLAVLEPGPTPAQVERFLERGTLDATPASDVASSEDLQTETDAGEVNETNQEDIGRAFGRKDDLGAFITQLKDDGNLHNVPQPSCVKCGTRPKEPVYTSCQHCYCHKCLMADTVEATEANSEYNTCAHCGDWYTTKESYDRTNTEATRLGEARQFKKANVNDTINTWISSSGYMLPSAKTIAFKAQVQNWFKENKKVKIIVYTQFITMVKILSKICSIEKWSYLPYHGHISQKKRERTINTFLKNPSINILIASLRTGGVGLNLTAATRVVMIDPWWNSAVEEQAFCRTYRRGQDQETAMTRLVVRDTVDEHIIALQERKDRNIQKVMSDSSQKGKLDVKELLRLFGPMGEDDAEREYLFA